MRKKRVVCRKQDSDIFITSNDVLLEVIEKYIVGSKAIAIDSEFVRFDAKQPPKLALLQFKVGNLCALIDPLYCDVLPFIKYVFENNEIVKILHDAKQDIETMEYLFHLDLESCTIFDTQIADLFISYYKSGAPSYKSLVKKYCGKNLSKASQNSNWLQRPLEEKQIIYAINDVKYLIDIYSIQRNELLKLGRYEVFKTHIVKILSNYVNKIKTVKLVEEFVDKQYVESVYRRVHNYCEHDKISPAVICSKNDVRYMIAYDDSSNIDVWKMKYILK